MQRLRRKQSAETDPPGESERVNPRGCNHSLSETGAFSAGRRVPVAIGLALSYGRPVTAVYFA